MIGKWIDFYNTERPHSSFGGRTPAEAYGAARLMDMMDKKPDGLPTCPQVLPAAVCWHAAGGSTTETEYGKQDFGSIIR